MNNTQLSEHLLGMSHAKNLSAFDADVLRESARVITVQCPERKQLAMRQMLTALQDAKCLLQRALSDANRHGYEYDIKGELEDIQWAIDAAEEVKDVKK